MIYWELSAQKECRKGVQCGNTVIKVTLMKLISFAIPCYNSAAYMRKCIESVLPGGDDVEIIIVDDGSTKDNTGEIADEYVGSLSLFAHSEGRPAGSLPQRGQSGILQPL